MDVPGDEQKTEHAVSQTANDATETINHPWNELRTVTTFDTGSGRSTLPVSNVTGSQSNGHVTQRVNPATSVLIESLVLQLCAVFEADKARRKKIYYGICDKLSKAQLIDQSYNRTEFDVLRKQYQDALYNLIKAACLPTEGPLSISTPLPDLSRYHREFREISFIASGGFGKVYKAQNRLDRTEYAIKKIDVPVKRIKIINEHLNEVMTLARLNHPNIVPYKAAWTEPSIFLNLPSADRRPSGRQASKRPKKHKSSNSKSLKDSSSGEKSLSCKNNTSSRNKLSTTTGRRKIEEIIEESEIQEQSTSVEISFRNSNSNSNSDTNLDQTIDDSNESDTDNPTENSNGQVCTYSDWPQYVTLYIQMALCEQTLEKWMRGRINGTPLPIISEIFQQILRGVNYIHSQNVVHHDIKPSNIFISSSGELQIQLGDFGLSCPASPLQGEEYHNVLGTHMYAAPEQLAGKCNQKSDIYSVGVVLTELLIPTHTQMELSHLVGTLKCGNIPSSLPADRYKWAQIIVQMVQEDPQKRPGTQQLLQDINADKDITITELRKTVITLKDDISDKEHEIENLQYEIALLKERVKNLEKSSE